MKKISLLSVLAIAFSVPCTAQQVDEEVVESAGVQSRMIIASDDSEGGFPQVAFMSSDGTGMGEMFFSTGMEGMSGMGAPDIFGLAQNRGVQKEIELVDEQVAQLKEINSDFSKRIQDQMKSLRNNDGNFDLAKAKGLSEMIQNLNKEKNARMQDVFLPHQFDRLRQISLQTQMKRSGESSMLSNKDVIEALGLTEEQQKNLKKKAKELKTELDAEVKKLKEKVRDELFEELTRDQRKKLTEMLGNDYELKTPNFRDRIRRRRPNNSKEQPTEDK